MRVLGQTANGAILVLTESPEAIIIVQRREDLIEARHPEATARTRGTGEAEAEVVVATSKGRQGIGHIAVPAKSTIEEMSPGAMAQTDAEEKECTVNTRQMCPTASREGNSRGGLKRAVVTIAWE